MKTGVLFDSCTVHESTTTSHPLYHTGDPLHSLIHSLSPDPIIDNYDSSDDWFGLVPALTDREERFNSLLSSLQEDYHSQYSFLLLLILRFFSPPPMCINQYRGLDFSSLRVSNSLPHASYLMEADNICYSPSIDSLLFSDFRGEHLNTHRFVDDYYANTIVVSDSGFLLYLSRRF